MRKVKIVRNEEKYWNFIRDLRTLETVMTGFIDQAKITDEQQIVYMQKFGDKYFIALYDGIPAGFVGVIDEDIRVATLPKFQNRGIGKTMVEFIASQYPNACAKVKTENVASRLLFEKCGYKVKYYLMYKD